jgi:adenosylhomocysteine nucleosidase
MPYRLLQYWIANTAKARVRQAVVQAAQKQLTPNATTAEPLPKTCDIGFVFALGIESGCLEDRLQNRIVIQGDGIKVLQGTLSGRGVVLMLSGPGQKNVTKATQGLIDGHKPSLIVSAGFAGGLNAAMKRSDILLANRVVLDHGGELPLDFPSNFAALAEQRGVHQGSLVTTDHVIRLPRHKRELGEKYHAAAVDMETYYVAEVCQKHQIPFAAVRVINDTSDETLPNDIEHLLMQKSGAAQFGAALGAILNRPGSVKDLYQLRENALVASDRLAKFLANLVA